MAHDLSLPLARHAALPGAHLVPALIADAGDAAGWRYVEFFAANIRNSNTCRVYARACATFFAWCAARGLTLVRIRPFDVAAWIELLQATHSPFGVKWRLAAVRMLCDWLVTGQILPTNPAAAVRGPKYVVNTGKTPVLEPAEWRRRAVAVGIFAPIGNHTFRASGITAYLSNGGLLEHAQAMAAHDQALRSNAGSAQQDEVERIRL